MKFGSVPNVTVREKALSSRRKTPLNCGARRVPGRPCGQHARIRYRLGGRRLGYRADNHFCAGAGGARLRRHSRIERRSHSIPADPAGTELSGATRARREEGNTHAGDRRRATLCPLSKATRKKSPRTASVTVPRKLAVASFITRHE
jgi:hypothetical protein